MELPEFEDYITEAISMVPVHIRKRIENVVFIVDDEQVGNLLGLYTGIPLPRRGQGYSGVLPDKITIYKKTIEAISGDIPEQIRHTVIRTVHHEIGHYFGFDEPKVRSWEKQRALRVKKEST